MNTASYTALLVTEAPDGIQEQKIEELFGEYDAIVSFCYVNAGSEEGWRIDYGCPAAANAALAVFDSCWWNGRLMGNDEPYRVVSIRDVGLKMYALECFNLVLEIHETHDPLAIVAKVERVLERMLQERDSASPHSEIEERVRVLERRVDRAQLEKLAAVVHGTPRVCP